MVMEQIKMPQLGESVTEGTISKWFVSAGSKIKKFEPLAEVITDKVTAEIPSLFDGVIKEILAAEGDTFSVGETICIVESTEVFENNNVLEPVSETAAAIKSAPKSVSVSAPAAASNNKIRYSPAVLKLSQEHGIDLNQVQGSGAYGRITRKDLLGLIESGSIPKALGKTINSNVKEYLSGQKTIIPKGPEPVETVDTQAAPSVSASAGDIEIPLTAVRKAIASNMLRSMQEVPHAWTMVEVDVTNMVEYRNAEKDVFKQREGFNLTYFAFFIKAIAKGLKEFPELNSMWAGNKIIQKRDINISIAVATETALFVPVIKHADEKSIKGIAREISEYANKARAGKLTLEDIEGGTFTVNNTGTFGSVQSKGIINYPQAAILQVESIIKRPVVVNNNMIAIRDMVNLCLSLDHRVLDGLICGRFLNRVKEILENTTKENTSIY